MYKKLYSAFILLFLFVLGFYLTIIPIRVGEGVDKIYHFSAFFIVTLIVSLIYVVNFGKKHLNFFIVAVLIFGALLGAFSEGLQSLTSIRACDPDDWITNLLGMTIAVMLVYLLNVKSSKQEI